MLPGLAAIAGLLLLTACSGGPVADPGPSPAPPTRHVVAREADRVGDRGSEPPRSVRLPGGTSVAVRPVDARGDGLLAVPHDVRKAGWWRGGSRIGDPFGATLLAGHVDSASQGLGRFARLLSVRAGDRIGVRTAHLRQEFVVVTLRLIPQGPLRNRAGLWSVAGPRRLVLVTCAPPYDPTRGGYQRLAVVTARPSGGPHDRR